ncbi:MAG: hypothetical protein OQK12_04865 [Motiliproteus sp.]|nr:hypothetical protein [Motiliproteus sp.]MCW9051029.1 hypothetical protein [Motiliproteus sp.]
MEHQGLKPLALTSLILLLGASIFLLTSKFSFSKPNQVETISADKRLAKTDKNLNDCLNELKHKIAGWCELKVLGDNPGISNVWPQKQPKIHQTVGPEAILIAWGTAAYDSQSKTIYFMGGGGTDYGGNEVYSFSLVEGEWRRLTDPSPLNYFTGIQRKFWIPDIRIAPPSSHLHDGLIFAPETGTLLLLAHSAAYGARITDKQLPSDEFYIPNGSHPRQYEFNPSSSESRNGLPPLTWRLVDTRPWAFPRSAKLDDGTLLIGSKSKLFYGRLNETGKLDTAPLLSHGDYGAVNLVYDQTRELIWFISPNYLVAYNKQAKRRWNLKLPFNSAMSLAIDKSGEIVLWDGFGRVYSMNPDKDPEVWRIAAGGENSPTKGRTGPLYGKWFHIGENIFIGASSHRHGVWVYKHATNNPLARNLSKTNLQSLINKSPEYSTIKLPPGFYGKGISINKPLTVDMEGVEIFDVYGGKALVVIESNRGPVTVKNFVVDGKRTTAKTGNLAAFRISGESFEVNLENIKITDTALGIMTDNRGGTLKLFDSYLSDIGSAKKTGLSHILYAGSIDSLVVKNSVLQRSMRLGHILKSRAKHTEIISSNLLGLDGRHSRVVDFPCGGTLKISNSILQNSTRSDNSDLISIGVESPANCNGEVLPGFVELTGNTIVFDRGLGIDDLPSRKKENRLFTWRSGKTGLTMKDNLIVSPGGTYILNQEIEGHKLQKPGSNNRLVTSRKAAGLNSEPDTSP